MCLGMGGGVLGCEEVLGEVWKSLGGCERVCSGVGSVGEGVEKCVGGVG